MPRRNLPGYLKHKQSDQAYCLINGRHIYLGKYGSKANRERYEEIIAEYLANGRKLPTTLTKTGIICRELSVHFTVWN
jgi:hypothetical protein